MSVSQSPRFWRMALVVTAGVVYARSLGIPFFFDDPTSIELNPHVRSLWPLTWSMGWPDETTVAGRPLVALSLAFNHALGGLEVTGYHLFNLVVHLANGLLLFALLRAVLGSRRLGAAARSAATPLAGTVSLLWSLHPLQTEAVAYVVQRTELMMTCAYLATALAAWHGFGARAGRARWFTLAVVLNLMGMASKEVMVSAPLFVLLLDRTLVSRSFKAALTRHGPLYLGLAGGWVLLAALVSSGPRGDSVGLDLGVGWFEYLLTQAQVLVHYLRLSLWPSPLVVSYEWPIVSGVGEVWWQGLLVLAALAGTGYGILRRSPWALPAALAFLVLAPTSSVLPIATEVAAERRMYLPLAGLLTLGVLAAWRLLAPRRTPHGDGSALGGDGGASMPEASTDLAGASPVMAAAPAALSPTTARCAALVTVLSLVCAGVSFDRLGDYADEHTIWTDAVAKRPHNFFARFQLAWTLQKLGHPEDAMVEYERSYALQPAYGPNLVNMGNCFMELGNVPAAMERFREARSYDPDDAVIWHNMGLALTHLDDIPGAIAHMQRAVELQPDYADAHCNLAVLLVSEGLDTERVATHLGRALELQPDHPEALALLGRLQAGAPGS